MGIKRAIDFFKGQASSIDFYGRSMWADGIPILYLTEPDLGKGLKYHGPRMVCLNATDATAGTAMRQTRFLERALSSNRIKKITSTKTHTQYGSTLTIELLDGTLYTMDVELVDYQGGTYIVADTEKFNKLVLLVEVTQGESDGDK